MIAIPIFRRRLLMGILLTMLAGIIGTLARTSTPPKQTLATWSPAVWYRINASSVKPTFRLPASSGRFTLVIGCLADASESHAVRLRLSDQSTALADVSPLEIRQRGSVERRLGDITNQASPRRLNSSNVNDYAVAVGTTRDFYLHVTDGDLNDPKQYARLTARCVGQGERVRVFVDQQLGTNDVPDNIIANLIQSLESDVLPRVEGQYGSLRDVDGDGHFAIVLSPWLSRLQGGRVSINGMVRASDFQADIAPPLGNRCDMLLLNSTLPTNSAALRDLLSHEVAHAACISQRISLQPLAGDEHDWVSEALAHLAEPGWSNLDYRIATFLDDPAQCPLVVPDYYRVGMWRNPGCRGATYLFAKWCEENNEARLCRRLAQSTEQGTRNFEQETMQSFEDLFRQWSVAIADHDRFRPLDLCRRVGSRQLAGIRRHRWNCDSGELSLNVRGTAITVVEMNATDAATRTICLDGDPAAHWQYSIQRIPDEWPEIELHVDSVVGDSEIALVAGADSNDLLSVRIEERQGRAIELVSLVFDHRGDKELKTICWNGTDSPQNTPRRFDSRGRLSFSMRPQQIALPFGGWTAKAVVRDAAGCTTTAWVELHWPSRKETAGAIKVTTAVQ